MDGLISKRIYVVVLNSCYGSLILLLLLKAFGAINISWWAASIPALILAIFLLCYFMFAALKYIEVSNK